MPPLVHGLGSQKSTTRNASVVPSYIRSSTVMTLVVLDLSILLVTKVGN